MRALVAGAAALVLAQTAAAATVDRTGFRYTRPLEARPGLVLVEPDGLLYAHTRPGFADLRVVDARGLQVPWRRLPPFGRLRETRVELLNRGRSNGAAVALVDLGPQRRVHNRLELELPDNGFVGAVVVSGSDDRRTFTRLSRTQIYDLHGARVARSTVAVFPPTDYRYLLLRATGVSTIAGAMVVFDPRQPPQLPVAAKTTISQRGGVTMVELDLGFRNVPVDEIRVDSSTPRFDRPVAITASNRQSGFGLVGSGRLTRFRSVSFTSIPVGTRHRYLRMEIRNGDDPPLADLRVTPLAAPRRLLLAPGFQAPYRLFYGDLSLSAPRYDFALVPPAELDLERAGAGRLGVEVRNTDFEPPEDARSFAERHPVVVQGALALAAIAVAGAGLLALRRRT